MRSTKFILVFALAVGVSLGFPLTAQDWERANAETVRLKPAAFSALPVAIRQELDRRGCEVPQTFSNKAAHNVIRGRFTSATQADIAVLCSRERVSTVLVFRNGATGNVAELAKQSDADFLQVVSSGGLVGYSRALGVASPTYIEEQYAQYGGPKPPPLDHDGINDIFVEKGSVVWYWYRGRWLQLQGSD